METKNDLYQILPSPVLEKFDEKDLPEVNAILYEMLAELDSLITQYGSFFCDEREEEWVA